MDKEGTKIIWYDFNAGVLEGLPDTFDEVVHYRLNEHIIFKGTLYEITDIRTNIDEGSIRYGLTKMGIPRQ